MAIGERIKERRIELGKTQDELAKELGWKSRSTICKIEANEQYIGQKNIVAFAKALDMTIPELMGWNEYAKDVDRIELASVDVKLKQIIDIFSTLSEKSKNELLNYAEYLSKSKKR